MKKHRIFNKGDNVYCLLSSFTYPDVLIPVRGFIVDTQWDPINPKYRIRIVKFYDNLVYLKKYFFDMKMHRKFGDRPSAMNLKKDEFKNVPQLEKFLNDESRENYYVTVDSLMSTKTKVELNELYNKVQFYIISRNLKQIKEISSRQFYSGHMSVDSTNEFDARIRKGWKSKFDDTQLDIDKYLKTLG